MTLRNIEDLKKGDKVILKERESILSLHPQCDSSLLEYSGKELTVESIEEEIIGKEIRYSIRFIELGRDQYLSDSVLCRKEDYKIFRRPRRIK